MLIVPVGFNDVLLIVAFNLQSEILEKFIVPDGKDSNGLKEKEYC